MKSISFVRHGKSSCEVNKKLRGLEYSEWVRSYDEAGIRPIETAPAITKAAFEVADYVVASDLRRAVESAHFLTDGETVKQLSLLREVSMPAPPLLLSFFIAKPNVWNVIMRLLWLTGYSGEVESYRQAKKRAKQAAGLLIDYADQYGHVVVVGHGFFNHMIGKQLKNQGWHSVGKHANGNWTCSKYEIME